MNPVRPHSKSFHTDRLTPTYEEACCWTAGRSWISGRSSLTAAEEPRSLQCSSVSTFFHIGDFVFQCLLVLVCRCFLWFRSAEPPGPPGLPGPPVNAGTFGSNHNRHYETTRLNIFLKAELKYERVQSSRRREWLQGQKLFGSVCLLPVISGDGLCSWIDADRARSPESAAGKCHFPSDLPHKCFKTSVHAPASEMFSYRRPFSNTRL